MGHHHKKRKRRLDAILAELQRITHLLRMLNDKRRK